MKRVVLALVAAILALPLHATIILSPIFGDGMVLQRNSQTKIWGVSDSGGKVTISTSWDGKLYTCSPAPNGSWTFNISTPGAGGPYSITIDDGDKMVISNVSVGEVWICSGQSNMEMTIKGYPNQPVENAAEYVMQAAEYDIHVFTVERALANSPASSCRGGWKTSDYANVPGFSATAYLFARALQKSLNVPVGIIVSAWGGSSILGWMPGASVAKAVSETEKQAVLESCGTAKDQPSVLYNAMIAPLVGYSARGFIWYQGEANVSTPEIYGKMLKAMVLSWRQAWGDRKNEMPFYAVEIAPYRYGKMCELKFDRPLTVEATVKALNSISNASVAPTGDIGDATVIHPSRKKEVGDRLAMLALRNQYGYEGLECYPPSIRKIEYRDGSAFIYTEGADIATTGRLFGFEISGKDECYYQAKALVNRKEGFIQVSSPDVSNPVAVRYGFRNFVNQNWKTWMGIPALPFRTENWDYSQQQ